MLSALRAYDQLRTIEWNRRGLEKILDASASLFEHRSLTKFVDGVIMHIRSLVRNAEGALLCAVSDSYYSGNADQVQVMAGVAPFAIKSGTPIRETLSEEACSNICRALDLQKSIYQDDYCVIFFNTVDHASTVIYLCGHKPLNDIDRHLLEVFCSKVAVGLDNVSLFEKICHESTHDTLTNLYNRGSFVTMVEQSLEAMRTEAAAPFAVLVLNLDRFADVNHELGYEAGDLYLQVVADTLRCSVDATDDLARLGGDEFALLLRGVDGPRLARLKAEMVESALAEPIRLGDQEVQPRASIGIAVAAGGGGRAEDLIAAADSAMHQAKQRGGGRIQLHQPAPEDKRPEGRLRLVSDLAHALERGQFELYYQPIIRLADEGLAGFEALLRWNHPQRGMVMPGSFIALAESTGMIVPVGAWVIRNAVRQMSDWTARYAGASSLMMSVNVSARQFYDQDMAEEVRGILAATTPQQVTISASRLKIEVTESLIMGDSERAVGALKDLKSLGTMLALDDFGTGYASLSYLHRFPFDIIKIDRSFVSSMRQQPQSMAIVRTICTLARELNLDVVAEGIEHAEEAAVLRDLGVSLCQGYYFSRPLCAVDAERLVAAAAAAAA
ncbi:MAG: EAL domain-containing protein [Rhodospirillaceae bacterium]